MGPGISFEELLANAPSGFLFVDAGGQIIWANNTITALFGYTPEELTGQPVEVLIPEELRRSHEAHRASYSRDPHRRPMGAGLSLAGRHKDGSQFPVDIALAPAQALDGSRLYTAAIHDISERVVLERERALLETELRTERERDRIAMDLHDGILQDIYATSLTLELALARGPAAGAAEAARVESAIEQLHEVVRDIRSYIFDLRPREFSGRLADALTALAKEFQQNTQIAVDIDIESDTSLSPDAALAVYHIAHESLSNVQKHSRAQHVAIRLRCSGEGSHCTLEIADDGIGFDTGKAASEEHRGLRNMAARAQALGGEFSIASVPGKGTRSTVRLPSEQRRR
jgi:PAS domain S-box-containing protein